MATNREEVVVRAGFDNTALASGLRKASSLVGSFASEASRLIGGGLLLAGMQKVISKFDELKDRADNLSVSTDFLQGMAQISKRDAVGGVETFNRAIAELSVRLGEAKEGGEEAIKKFQKWGITLSDIASMDSEQMFYKIADTIKSIQDPAQRSAAAFDLLGKSGKNMAGVLANGGEQIKTMVDAVDKLNEEQVKALAETQDLLDDAGSRALVWAGKVLLGVRDIARELGAMKIFGGGGRENLYDGAEGLKRFKDEQAAYILANSVQYNPGVTSSSRYDSAAADELDKRNTARLDAMRSIKSVEEQIADTKKELAGLDETAFDYADQRAKLLLNILNSEDLLTKKKKEQTEIDRHSAIVDRTARDRTPYLLSVRDLAGKNFTRRLDEDYGEGGRFDLRHGSPFADKAQQLETLQHQYAWNVLHPGMNPDSFVKNQESQIDALQQQFAKAGIGDPLKNIATSTALVAGAVKNGKLQAELDSN